ncbi:MAG: phosphopantetheine-binding protein [Clostridiales bacterium]|nr:phosphopantetheine-binding protein [Clostridiales bacterium]
MLENIIEILNEITGADEGEIQPDTELFAEGVLDSFGLVQLLVALEEQGAALDAAELDRDAISTPEKIAALAEQAR